MASEVREAARALLPGIAKRAERADEAARVPAETIDELREAGVFRLLQPASHGGLEGDPVELYATARELSQACPSTGWLAAVLGVHAWHLGLFTPAAQKDVWAETRDTLLSSSYAPIGRLQPVEDGYQLSGRWSFSSGVEHADWALLGAMQVGARGEPVDFITVLVPRKDFRIERVWNATGLRGTASDDVLVDGVFVPAHRALRNYEMAKLRGPGQEVNDGPLYRLPFGTVFTYAITAPVLGAAESCYRAIVETMRSRTRLSLGGGRYVEDPYVQAAVGRAASEIDAGVLQTERNLREMVERAAVGDPIPMELRLRARRDQVRATERGVQAADLLFKIAGGTSLQRGNPIERAWRDAHAASMHVANETERALAMYGRGAFGLGVEENLV